MDFSTSGNLNHEKNTDQTLKRHHEEVNNGECPNPKQQRNDHNADRQELEADSREIMENGGEGNLRNEETQISDSIFLFHKRKISDHGNVFEGEIRSGVYGVRVCAIKLVQKSEQNFREAAILTKLSSHTHVVSIIQSGYYTSLFEEFVYIALDKCHEHNLGQHIAQKNKYNLDFNLNGALEYSKQIICGLSYVHENLIIHKDLKPSNILLSLDKSTIKIADFGLSQEIKSKSSKVYCKHQFGTNGFRPLESFGNDWASLKSDIFSLGVLLYFMLSNGKSPLGDEITLWMHNTIHRVIDLSHLLVPNSKTFQHLIKLMLSKDRRQRPSITNVADHPCWAGKDVECDFDYDYETEVVDYEDEIMETDEQLLIDSQSEAESQRQFFKAVRNLGYVLSAKSQAQESSIVVFVSRPMRLQRFNVKSNSVSGMQEFSEDMKENIYNFSAISFGGYIYVLSRKAFFRLKYNNTNAIWERLPDLIDDHGDKPPAGAISGMIYVVGSCNGTETNSVSRYDTLKNEWKKVNDKELVTNWSAIVTLDGYLYSIGGAAEGIGMTDIVERLNIYSHAWDRTEPMLEGRYGASAVVLNRKIIVAGGIDSRYQILNSVEKYDPDFNQWTMMKPMLKGRRWYRCHVIDGDIYAVYGSEEKESVEMHDSKNGEWKLVAFPRLDVLTRESVAIQFERQLT